MYFFNAAACCQKNKAMMIYDTIIIGSGPAGLTAAIYASRAKLKAVVCEKDVMGSGAIAVTEQVDNFPALPGISGYELGEKMRGHAIKAGAEIITAEASAIKPSEHGFDVSFKDGSALSSRTVIYAAGTSYRRLDIPGDKLLGVSYCAVCDGAFYENRTAAVIGGGDTALTDALYLSQLAEKVLLVHRRSEFRANPSLVEKVKGTRNIELVLNAKPLRILGEKNVTGLEITRNDNNATLKTDGVFVAIGSVPNTTIAEGLAELDKSGYIIAAEDGKTSLNGFFAAGDVRAKAMRQVITACSDGANCVNSVCEYLNSFRDTP